MNVLAKQARSGSGIETSAARIPDDCHEIRLRATIDAADRAKPSNSYTIGAWVSPDDGATWTFIGGGSHAGFGEKYNKKTQTLETWPEPVLRLTGDGKTPLWPGALIKAVIESPKEMQLGIDIEF